MKGPESLFGAGASKPEKPAPQAVEAEQIEPGEPLSPEKRALLEANLRTKVESLLRLKQEGQG